MLLEAPVANGSVYRRDDRKKPWIAHISWHEGDRRRQSKLSYLTKRETQEALDEAIDSHRRQEFVAPTAVRVWDFFETIPYHEMRPRQDLADNGLSNVIDRSAFAGCWNARYIAGSARMSRHSFGAAADINIFNSTDGGPGSPVNPELLKRIYAAGLTSGHVWRNSDPGHFEFFEIVGSS